MKWNRFLLEWLGSTYQSGNTVDRFVVCVTNEAHAIVTRCIDFGQFNIFKGRFHFGHVFAHPSDCVQNFDATVMCCTDGSRLQRPFVEHRLNVGRRVELQTWMLWRSHFRLRRNGNSVTQLTLSLPLTHTTLSFTSNALRIQYVSFLFLFQYITINFSLNRSLLFIRIGSSCNVAHQLFLNDNSCRYRTHLGLLCATNDPWFRIRFTL